MNGLSNREKGSHRDRRILDLLQSRVALDTEQVRAIVFPGMKSGLRKAQERLQKLHARKRVKRVKLDPNSPYIYYMDKRHGRIEHLVALNWVYAWTVRQLKPWETLHRWDYEQDYGILRADAFAVVKNNVTDKFKFYFVELDRSENVFDKVDKYCALYESENYSWWGDCANRFPPVVIVTTSLSRLRHIQGVIGRDNRAGLQFEVYLLDFIKEACSK